MLSHGKKLFRPKWTNEIHEEWISNLLEERPDLNPEALAATRKLMGCLLLKAMSRSSEQLRAELSQLQLENTQLRAENLRLKSDTSRTRVFEQSPIYQAKEPIPQNSAVANGSSRTKLFQTLFHARDDVYAERWQKKDGTKNYSPAKLHQWDSHTKNERGKWQCGPDCRLLPLVGGSIKARECGDK